MEEIYSTYAGSLRMAAKKKNMSLRQLATASGFCYEHIRKIMLSDSAKRKDKPLTISEECNSILCELLDLPAAEMAALAEREKFSQKNGYAPVQLPDPLGQELSDLWEHLNDEQKHVMLRMGKGFAAEMAIAS